MDWKHGVLLKETGHPKKEIPPLQWAVSWTGSVRLVNESSQVIQTWLMETAWKRAGGTLFKNSPFVFHTRKKIIWVWNDITVSKWCQIYHSFKDNQHFLLTISHWQYLQKFRILMVRAVLLAFVSGRSSSVSFCSHKGCPHFDSL